MVTAGKILEISRRWYAGELTVLHTASGDELRVTANHPVLTDHGWLPGHLVREGDSIFRCLDGHGAVDGRPDEQQTPMAIEDIWASLSVAGDLHVMPLATEDFHADVAEGEVEIVRPYSNLAAVRNTEFGQPTGELSLVSGHGRRPLLATSGVFGSFIQSGHTASAGSMGGAGLSFPFSGSHFAGAQQASLATSPRFDAPREQFSSQSASVYARRGLDLVGRLASRIERDRVVEVRGVSFADHVYNLHTDEGWYSSNNHIISNCDCGTVPIIGNKDPGQVIDEITLEAVHDAIARDLGAQYVDRGARAPLDYRKVVIEHHHGELGAVLGVKGQHVQGPPR